MANTSMKNSATNTTSVSTVRPRRCSVRMDSSSTLSNALTTSATCPASSTAPDVKLSVSALNDPLENKISIMNEIFVIFRTPTADWWLPQKIRYVRASRPNRLQHHAFLHWWWAELLHLPRRFDLRWREQRMYLARGSSTWRMPFSSRK